MDNLAETPTPPQADLLLTCLHTNKRIDRNRLAQTSLIEWQNLFDLARIQGVAPLLYHHFKTATAQKTVPNEIWQKLVRQFKSTALRNMSLLSELHHIIKALDKAEIPAIVLKGAYLAPIVYPDIGLRPMGDLDLLIPTNHILKATTIIETQGYKLPREINDRDLQFSYAHHLPQMIKEGKYFVEIHSRLTKSYETWTCNPQTWWQETRTVKITGLQMKVLSPIDLILHLCIHISYSHRFSIGLKHYYDLEQLLRFLGPELDWNELVKRIQLRGWEKGVRIVLQITQLLFGLDLPEKSMNKLNQGKNDEEIINFAIAEMWASPTSKTTFLSKEVAEYCYRTGFWSKINYFRQRIFIPKGLMAEKYPVPTNSLWIYPCYLLRIKDLFYKHHHTLQQMSQGDTKTTTTATRKHNLWCWLNDAHL